MKHSRVLLSVLASLAGLFFASTIILAVMYHSSYQTKSEIHAERRRLHVRYVQMEMELLTEREHRKWLEEACDHFRKRLTALATERPMQGLPRQRPVPESRRQDTQSREGIDPKETNDTTDAPEPR